MAPAPENFVALLDPRTEEITELQSEDEYLRLGSHMHLAHSDSSQPVLYLHIYCQRLEVPPEANGWLQWQVHDRGCALKSLDIFAAYTDDFYRLTLIPDGRQGSVELRIFYDRYSGPVYFMVNDINGEYDHAVQIVKSQDVLMTSPYSLTLSPKFVNLGAPEAAGVRFSVSGASGIVDSANPILAVPLNELLPVSTSEFDAYGAVARRLHNLPRLLERLFVTACEELMGKLPRGELTDMLEPSLKRVMAKFRFIRSCAREASNLAGLVAEASILLDRVQLPAGFFDTAESTKKDQIWLTAPIYAPKFLEDGMKASVDGMLLASGRIKDLDYNQEILDAVNKSNLNTLQALKVTTGVEITQAELDQQATDAANGTKAVSQKLDELRQYRAGASQAREAFESGFKAYMKKEEEKLVLDLVVSVIEVTAAVGAAIYSGGAATPAAGAALGGLVESAQKVSTATRLVKVLKALGESMLKVGPKIMAALSNHASFLNAASTSETALSKIEEAAKTVDARVLSAPVAESIDFPGLMADWREIDIQVDLTFRTIRDVSKDIAGTDAYEEALKKLVIRGETLINVLKIAYDARKEYLLTKAQQKAKDAAIAEIQAICDRVKTESSAKSLAIMALKQDMLNELAQQRRKMFRMLHLGVLALVYQSNDFTILSKTFGGLSPAESADELQSRWSDLTQTNVDTSKDIQTEDLIVDTTQSVFPKLWFDLLCSDYETPFQIPMDLKELRKRFHMRIDTIYAEFQGLKRKSGKPPSSADKPDKPANSADKPEYVVSLGPLVLDRFAKSEYDDPTIARTVSYYMPVQSLTKRGEANHFVDPLEKFAKRGLCSTGKLSFDPESVRGDDGWDLSTIEKITLHIGFQTREFRKIGT